MVTPMSIPKPKVTVTYSTEKRSMVAGKSDPPNEELVALEDKWEDRQRYNSILVSCFRRWDIERECTTKLSLKNNQERLRRQPVQGANEQGANEQGRRGIVFLFFDHTRV